MYLKWLILHLFTFPSAMIIFQTEQLFFNDRSPSVVILISELRDPYLEPICEWWLATYSYLKQLHTA